MAVHTKGPGVSPHRHLDQEVTVGLFEHLLVGVQGALADVLGRLVTKAEHRREAFRVEELGKLDRYEAYLDRKLERTLRCC